jgi:hypothetical protein
MILPTKHLRVEKSLLAVGADVLAMLRRPRTITILWDDIRSVSDGLSFEKFALTLAFLHAIGAVEFEDDLLKKVRP